MNLNDYGITFPLETKFLVTGGAGFIGSNICEVLLENNYKVICFDNLSTGKIDNVEMFTSNPNYTFIKGDITDLDTCIDACKGIDYVIHQAAWGSVPRSIEMPLLYNKNNIEGTLNMMEAARVNKVRKFVYASSSSVYGNEPSLPKKENRIGEVLSPYALTKKVNEEYGKLYSELYDLETCGLRYFNVFGKRQDPNGAYAAVLPKFINQLINNTPPTINGDGNQSRDFTYIENVVEANLKACLSPKYTSGKVYNVAVGDNFKLIDVYNMLINKLDKEIKPNFVDERKGDIKHSNADISKIKNDLNYFAKWSFEEGLDEYINWFKNNNELVSAKVLKK